MVFIRSAGLYQALSEGYSVLLRGAVMRPSAGLAQGLSGGWGEGAIVAFMSRKDRDTLAAALDRVWCDVPVEWHCSAGLTDYAAARALMRDRAAAIAAGKAGELVWLVEHEPLYTAGTSAREEDLLWPERFPVHRTGRGGQYTYHGPGQRVAYVMLDLRRRGRDVRAFVTALEQWIIDALKMLGVCAGRREDRVGVWVRREDGRDEKIAAIGVRVSRWVSRHGIAVNVHPDLSHFSGIVPCGVSDHGVTSLHALGADADMEQCDAALRAGFERIFGPVRDGGEGTRPPCPAPAATGRQARGGGTKRP